MFERYGVILTDRARARLFTLFMGEIEEHDDLFAPGEVRNLKTTGTDQIWSQKQFQRRAAVHARAHLAQVAEQAERLRNRHGFDRLVLGGPAEAVTELEQLLPKPLRARVVRTIPLAVEAGAADVLSALMPKIGEVERAVEAQDVEALITAGSKHDRAVLGLEQTLPAIGEQRVLRLLYAENFTASGWQCEACAALTLTAGACLYCGGKLRLAKDVIESMIQQALETGARIELVRDPAASRMRQVGGIGAHLRF